MYAHEGTVRARRLEQQTEQAWCLTLTTNAVIAWTTEYGLGDQWTSRWR
nr:transposase [Saccharopolyspora sp. ASAGF58]